MADGIGLSDNVGVGTRVLWVIKLDFNFFDNKVLLLKCSLIIELDFGRKCNRHRTALDSKA
jgi:hypothetical protein